MMEVRNVRRAAIDRWLQLARLPFDAVAHLLPSDHGSRNAAMLVIDRADASVRAAVGGLLHDDDLRADAFRRRAAADERERAIELRIAAKDESTRCRRGAGRGARGRGTLARTSRRRSRSSYCDKPTSSVSSSSGAVQQVAGAQELAIELAREEQLAVEDKQAKRERLNVLDDQADALDQEADASPRRRGSAIARCRSRGEGRA